MFRLAVFLLRAARPTVPEKANAAMPQPADLRKSRRLQQGCRGLL